MGDPTTEHINNTMNRHVSEPASIPSQADVTSILSLKDATVYMDVESFSGNPDALLGAVIQIRQASKGQTAQPEFCATKIRDTPVDPNSHLKEPLKRKSIIVDHQLSLNVGFLNYLSAELKAGATFSLMVFDQATGLADRNATWNEGLKDWKNENQDLFEDAAVAFLFVVIGYVQKYVIRKTFKKFDVKAKGGMTGLNVSGELYTSNEDYSLDIRYGLTVAALKRSPTSSGLGGTLPLSAPPATIDEIALMQRANKIEYQGAW